MPHPNCPPEYLRKLDGELERVYRLYRTWGHAPVDAYIEARKLKLPPGGMFWFFVRKLKRTDA